jgi:acyl dehydratase
MIDISDLSLLSNRLGEEIAVSDWLEITQDRVDQFAEATGDRQWIHTDPARAAADSPFHATIAHGFLTMSLVTTLLRRTFDLSRVRMALNYGVNKVRFVTAVPVGSRIRARFTPAAVKKTDDGGIQVAWNITVEREGADRPCAVVEWLVRYYITQN